MALHAAEAPSVSMLQQQACSYVDATHMPIIIDAEVRALNNSESSRPRISLNPHSQFGEAFLAVVFSQGTSSKLCISVFILATELTTHTLSDHLMKIFVHRVMV